MRGVLRSRYVAVNLTAASVLTVLAGSCATAPPPAPPPVAAPPPPPTSSPPRLIAFEATAYSIRGRTASGTHTRPGIVAADPKILPLGSRIRVHGAEPYSGVYEVADTGRTIDGHEIDIYIPSKRAAKRFGRRRVKVEVLRYGSR
jgi:3D (Asp-Asp-Asp) domain-containing protein